MDIKTSVGRILEQSADTLLIFMLSDGMDTNPDNATYAVDNALNGLISNLQSLGEFKADANETLILYPQNLAHAKRLIVVGLGTIEKFTPDVAKRAVATGMQKARALTSETVATMTVGIGQGNLSMLESGRAIAEGSLLGLYQYQGQKSSELASNSLKTLIVALNSSEDTDDVDAGIKMGSAFAEGAILARNLVNLPPNICTPTFMGDQAITMAQEVGLQAQVLGKQQIQALKMGAILAVARGSDTPPRFIILEHNLDKIDYDTIVLIGKGVTFDTGGYSLKTRDGMVTMKGDMAGGAAVIGAMKTIALLDLPLRVIGLIPSADNRVNGDAYLPQEVVTASNGKTIEIISTDAEGRMLLADALVYAKRYSPNAVVDIATLTGSSVVALGAQASSLFSTDDGLTDLLTQAGNNLRERVWRMPLYEEYFNAIESDTADMRNSAGSTGGVGTSAIFLKQFVDFPVWGHVDMAGLGSNASEQKNPYIPGKTATGYGARLLAEFVRLWSSKE